MSDGEATSAVVEPEGVSSPLHTVRVASWVRRVLEDNALYVQQVQGRTSDHLQAALALAHALGAAEDDAASGVDATKGPIPAAGAPTADPGMAAEERTGAVSALSPAVVSSAQSILSACRPGSSVGPDPTPAALPDAWCGCCLGPLSPATHLASGCSYQRHAAVQCPRCACVTNALDLGAGQGGPGVCGACRVGHAVQEAPVFGGSGGVDGLSVDEVHIGSSANMDTTP